MGRIIPYIMENKIDVPNHQPDIYIYIHTIPDELKTNNDS